MYTHTSSVISILSDMSRPLEAVAKLKNSFEVRDLDSVSELMPIVQNELHICGVKVDWAQAQVTKEAVGSLADYASVDQLISICGHLASDMLKQAHAQVESGLHVRRTDTGMLLSIHPPSKLAETLQSNVMSDEAVRDMSDVLRKDVFEPLLRTSRRWVATQLEHGLELSCSSDVSTTTLELGASVPELVAILSMIKETLAAQPRVFLMLSKSLIPPIIELFKAHLLRCKPPIESSQEATKLKEQMVSCTLEFHHALVQLQYVSDQMPRTKHLPCMPEPLSDLPMWTRTFDVVCKQHFLGCLIDQVRVLVLQGNDKCWDTETKVMTSPIHTPQDNPDLRIQSVYETGPLARSLRTVPQADGPPGLEFDLKPELVSVPEPKQETEPQTQPASAFRPKPSKSKKPTLGGVKIGAKLPVPVQEASSSLPPPKAPTPPPKVPTPEAQDDWGWGDEEADMDAWDEPDKSQADDMGSSVQETSEDPWNKTESRDKDAGTRDFELDETEQMGSSSKDENENGNDNENEKMEQRGPPKQLNVDVVPNETESDDWDWGEDEDENEIEKMLAEPATRLPAAVSDDPASGSNGADSKRVDSTGTTCLASDNNFGPKSSAAQVPDSSVPSNMQLEESLDAWEWDNDTGIEETPTPALQDPNTAVSAAPIASAASASPSMTATTAAMSSTITVSRRVLDICRVLENQWNHLDEDVPMRASLAHGFLMSVQLFRGLMPIVHAKVLQHVALLGMLYVNDCSYLASELRSYTSKCTNWGAFRLPGGPTFEVSLAMEADCLDNISAQWREALMNIQLNALHESLDGTDSFARTNMPDQYDACVRSIEQIEHILMHLSSVWSQVMRADELMWLLCQLVDAIFVRVLREMEDLQDISEQESNRLAELCRKLMDTASKVLHGSETDVPTYFKFAYLPDILQGSLADIEYLLFDNESGSALADYTRDEMNLLVRALFADTPQRRRLLDRIQRWT